MKNKELRAFLGTYYDNINDAVKESKGSLVVPYGKGYIIIKKPKI